MAQSREVLVTEPGVSHVLFDFFGTLVEYSSSLIDQGYHTSHALVRCMGANVEYAKFLNAWVTEWVGFEERSALDDSEFSMDEVAVAFLARLLCRRPTQVEISDLVDTYISEWNTGVTYSMHVPELVSVLARRFRLAVVTNTHNPDLVPNHLASMGIADYFDAVITSVRVGWRKPHPAIFAEALNCLGIEAASAVFVGDSYIADYVGPLGAGMAAFLIDSAEKFDVPADRRLRSLTDLVERLGIQEEISAP